LVAPAGVCSETNPAKTTFVPSPSSLGPITDRATERMPNTSTTISCGISERSVFSKRFALGPKFCAFDTGAPAPAPIGPPRGPMGPGREA
jgi:hypothetical protein